MMQSESPQGATNEGYNWRRDFQKAIIDIPGANESLD